MIRLSKVKKLIEKHKDISYTDISDYIKGLNIDCPPKVYLMWVTEELANQVEKHFLGNDILELGFGEHSYIATGQTGRAIIIPMYPDKIELYPFVRVGSKGYAEYQKYSQVVTIIANQFGNIDMGYWMQFLAPESEYSMEYYVNFICITFQAMKRITYDEFIKPTIIETGEKTGKILAAQRAEMAHKKSPIDMPTGGDVRPKVNIRDLDELENMGDRF